MACVREQGKECEAIPSQLISAFLKKDTTHSSTHSTIDSNDHTHDKVTKDTLQGKCNWSPFEELSFGSRITHTIVSGHLVYCDGIFDESCKGERLLFDQH